MADYDKVACPECHGAPGGCVDCGGRGYVYVCAACGRPSTGVCPACGVPLCDGCDCGCADVETEGGG